VSVLTLVRDSIQSQWIRYYAEAAREELVPFMYPWVVEGVDWEGGRLRAILTGPEGQRLTFLVREVTADDLGIRSMYPDWLAEDEWALEVSGRLVEMIMEECHLSPAGTVAEIELP